MIGDTEVKRKELAYPIDDGTLGFASTDDTKEKLDT